MLDGHGYQGVLSADDWQLNKDATLIPWPGGVMVTVLACDSRGAEFSSQPFHCQVV